MQQPSLLAGSAFCFAAQCLVVACGPSPTAPSGLGPLLNVSAGSIHTCGLTAVGAVYCWGANGGALGDGTTTERHTQVSVAMPAGVTFTNVSAGGGHTCGLTPPRAPYCWGSNAEGQVGDGTTTVRLVPTIVMLPTG